MSFFGLFHLHTQLWLSIITIIGFRELESFMPMMFTKNNELNANLMQIIRLVGYTMSEEIKN